MRPHGRFEVDSVTFVAVAVALVLLSTTPALAMFVDVQFIGSADIAGLETWSWGEGSPLPNQEVERTVRATVDELMLAKGYRKVDGAADMHLSIHAKADEWFDGGLVKIEAYEGATAKLMWRGKAEGTINVESTAKRQKMAVRTVKQMFKKFPDKRAE